MPAATDVLLDHVFLFVEPGGEAAAAALEALGLVESFRRDHPGQGTANRCYCFDNAYLELLWLRDRAEALSEPVARTGLAKRGCWRDGGTSPFGIALRTASGGPLPLACYDYAAPFLPERMTIAICRSSDDLNQPFVFRSPGDRRPDAWENGRAGARQTTAGFAEIAALHLELTDGATPSDDLLWLEAAGLLTLGQGMEEPGLLLTLSRRDGGPPRRLRLPEPAWAD